MTKYTNINDIEFETHKSKYANMIINCISHDKDLKTLDKCYNKPSEHKQAIYNEWRDNKI